MLFSIPNRHCSIFSNKKHKNPMKKTITVYFVQTEEFASVIIAED
jgi:hypothetical protein